MNENNPTENIKGGGRSTIDSPNRTNKSTRAMKGKLFVEKHRCSHCNHHKKFITIPTDGFGTGVSKCCKCKMEVPKK